MQCALIRSNFCGLVYDIHKKVCNSCAKIDVRLMGWDIEGGTDRTLFTKVALLHIWHHDCYSLYLLVVYNFLIVLNVVYIASLVLSCVRYFTHLISKNVYKYGL